MKLKPTISLLQREAERFCLAESKRRTKELFGVTDGKAVGTFIEHKFTDILSKKYHVAIGSSATGIDLPSEDILTDIKVTSIKQPQSSCPFKDARQKIFGLGYNLLVFVYDKTDDRKTKTARLDFVSCSFIARERTGDYTTTLRLREMIRDGANAEDIAGYLEDSHVSHDYDMLIELGNKVLQTPISQGYLQGSVKLCWAFPYERVVAPDVMRRMRRVQAAMDKAQ